jgi:aspartate 1-decarboxylase
VTDANLNYEGSITIDRELLDKAGMLEYELVLISNITNGARFETYIISGDPGSGKIELNGAAARLAHPGDKLIIMAFELVGEEQLEDWKPTIVLVNDKNQVKEILC